MAFGIGRRELIGSLGSAALAWPNTARAQKPAIPVVGYLTGTSPDDSIGIVADFRRGLAETGYVEGRNVAIEYRWLEGRYDRIPAMLGDLVEHRVTVIAVAHVTTAAVAAKSVTRTIPIVFAVGTDPVAIAWSQASTVPEETSRAYPCSKLQRPHSALNCCIKSSRRQDRSPSSSTRPTRVLPRSKPKRCSRRQMLSAWTLCC
jgi:hypothetical protein